MQRRLEFVQGSSRKFYAVSVTGQVVTTTFGRIGTTGQTQHKEFPTTDKAQQHADKVIAQKLAKGYTLSAA